MLNLIVFLFRPFNFIPRKLNSMKRLINYSLYVISNIYINVLLFLVVNVAKEIKNNFNLKPNVKDKSKFNIY